MQRPWFLNVVLTCCACWEEKDAEDEVDNIKEIGYFNFLKSEFQKLEQELQRKPTDMSWVCPKCITEYKYKTPSGPTSNPTSMVWYDGDDFANHFIVIGRSISFRT